MDSRSAAIARPHRCIGFIAGSQLPVEMKSVTVGADGRIRCYAPVRLHFGFEWCGIAFDARVDRENGRTTLSTTADLGPLPFTVEDSGARSTIFIAMTAANRIGHARFSVDKDQHIRLDSRFAMEQPLTPAALLDTTTALLLETRPTLDLIGALLAGAESRPAIAIA